MTTIRGATTLTLGAGTDANITGANANITATTDANITASGLVNISGGFVYSVQNITGPGAINLTDTVTFITTTGTDAYTLANGVEGQLKIIIMKVDGGNATITPDNLVGFTAVRFTDVNNSVMFLYGSTGWNILALQQATRIS